MRLLMLQGSNVKPCGAKYSKAGANRVINPKRETPPTAWAEGVLFGCGGRI